MCHATAVVHVLVHLQYIYMYMYNCCREVKKEKAVQHDEASGEPAAKKIKSENQTVTVKKVCLLHVVTVGVYWCLAAIDLATP